ncbi:MAG: phenylalanine--tRNA ligase subunit beta, partial [Xanthomonadales bacterium]|nr:phenylalanine--tRNA ligase subunit beta [Xanthomonadales bacterium]
MKVPENWLREHVTLAADSAAIAQRFNMIGLEVEAIEHLGSALEGVVVAAIVACEKHPQAERLQLCHVDAGGAIQVIVCGAPNARPGIKVPLATLGASLPGGVTIKAATLRGVESRGMLCSAKELAIDADASGLLELAADAPLGIPLATYLGLPATVFDLSLTPNRGDCLSIRGVARDAAAAFALPLTAFPIADVAATSTRELAVQLAADADCPRYAARVIEAVDTSIASPAWLRQRLQRSGVRPLSLLVDITNIVMLELGQPMHAFDAALVSGPIVVRHARSDERLKLLDEREVALDEQFLLVTDNDRPLALGGIMGGWDSRVTDATRDVLLEAAHFAPSAIAGRARRLGLHTEASHRFERGVDPSLPMLALHRATQLIVDIAGGRPGPISMAERRQDLPVAKPVALRRARLQRVLGIHIEDSVVERILCALGMQVTANAEGWLATPPSWRFDIAIEEDLIEEVARIHGYDAIPTRLPRGEIRVAAPDALRSATARLREQLVARDFVEAITYTFVPAAWLETWQLQADSIALANPLSADYAVMRPSLLPGLVRALVANRNRQRERVRLFELGRSYHAQPDGPREVARVAAVISGTAHAEQWGEASRAVDFYDLKGELQALLARD